MDTCLLPFERRGLLVVGFYETVDRVPDLLRRSEAHTSEAAIAHWKKKDWPEIKKTQKEQRTIVFIDESGLSQRRHRCRTWARRGKTPVLQYHFNWKMISVASDRGFRDLIDPWLSVLDDLEIETGTGVEVDGTLHFGNESTIAARVLIGHPIEVPGTENV